MSRTSQATDGRESLAYLVTDMEEQTATVSAGSFGIITGKAAAQSGFGEQKVNQPFYATKEITLAEGDSCKILKLSLLGNATSKDMSYSKETADTTMDYDDATSKVTNGQVSTSGSINGMFITESLGSAESAINAVKSRFGTIVEYDSEGNAKILEANTTEKDILVIVWNIRNAKNGDIVEVSIQPALLTQISLGSQYNSSQTFNISFDGSATDENNYEGIRLQIPFDKALREALPTARPTAQTIKKTV